MVFSKKWLRNHSKFLLHFLIHIDVLMLCSKFELIPTSIFQVTATLRKCQNFEKIPVPDFGTTLKIHNKSKCDWNQLKLETQLKNMYNVLGKNIKMENSLLFIFGEIWLKSLYYSTGTLTRFWSNLKNS